MTIQRLRRQRLVVLYSGMRMGEIIKARRTEDAFLLDDTKNGEAVQGSAQQSGHYAHLATDNLKDALIKIGRKVA